MGTDRWIEPNVCKTSTENLTLHIDDIVVNASPYSLMILYLKPSASKEKQNGFEMFRVGTFAI